jgi:hypothetical protein
LESTRKWNKVSKLYSSLECQKCRKTRLHCVFILIVTCMINSYWMLFKTSTFNIQDLCTYQFALQSPLPSVLRQWFSLIISYKIIIN